MRMGTNKKVRMEETEEMEMEVMVEMEIEEIEEMEMEGNPIKEILNKLNLPNHKLILTDLQDSALTWWNSHKRTIGVDAAYAIKWAGLMKLMTEVYCPRNEI
nr:putative reverse transcriptase domain-containing protein [Tanacetum cinerariifolium]